MLNMTTVTAKMAGHYYTEENYYHQQTNTFGGKLCGALGMESGGYNEQKMKDYLDWNYNGEKPIRSQANYSKDEKTGKAKRRNIAGIDLTFSAPKSVSICALVLKDLDIIEMHKQSVRETMEYIEKKLTFRMSSTKLERIYKERAQPLPDYVQNQFDQAAARGQKEFSVNLKAENGIVYTQCQHSVSRLNLQMGKGGDPDLHSHAIMACHTKCPLTGEYVSLDLKSLYKNQKGLDAIYKQRLATHLREKNYALTPTEFGFEISGISKKEIDAYSDGARIRIGKFAESEFYDRDAWIEVFGEEYNINDPKQRDAANRATRGGKKVHLSDEEAEKLWAIKAEQHSINLNKLHEKVIKEDERVKSGTEIITSLEYAIDLAAQHGTEKQSAIRKLSEFHKNIMNFSDYRYSQDQIEEGIQKALNEGSLITRQDGKSLTTRQRVEDEKFIEATFKSGLNQSKPICSPGEAKKALEAYELEKGFTLTNSQSKAFYATCASSNRYLNWIGDAGSGKSTVMELLRKTCEKYDNAEVVGYAPSNSAKRALSKSIPNTITSQSASINNKWWTENVFDRLKEGKNVYAVLDESSLVDAESKARLYKKCEEAARIAKANNVEFRELSVGDNKQFSSVQAGSVGHMLYELSKEAGCSIELDEMIRAKKNPETQKLHYLVRDTPDQALIKMLESKGSSIRINDRDERHEYLANQYVKLSDKEQENSLILTGKNADRIDINDAVRSKLKEFNRLGKLDHIITTFEGNDHTTAEAKHSGTYREGVDFVRFEIGLKKVAEAGDIFEVAGRVRDEFGVNLIKLRDQWGNATFFNPRTDGDRVSIGRIVETKISQNELMRMTSTVKCKNEKDEEISIKNGTAFRITKIISGAQQIEIKLIDSDEVLTMSTRERGLPLRYNACKTGHSAQGLGADSKCFLNLPYEDATINRESYYTNITRSTDHVEVVTDAVNAEHIENLLKSVQIKAKLDKALVDAPKEPEPKVKNMVWNSAMTKSLVLNELPGSNLAQKLENARAVLGSELNLTGSRSFRECVVKIALDRKLEFTFKDAASKSIVKDLNKIAEKAQKQAQKQEAKPSREKTFQDRIQKVLSADDTQSEYVRLLKQHLTTVAIAHSIKDIERFDLKHSDFKDIQKFSPAAVAEDGSIDKEYSKKVQAEAARIEIYLKNEEQIASEERQKKAPSVSFRF